MANAQYGRMKKVAAAFKGPKSLCSCGHTGDGPDSQHADRFQAGHGACRGSAKKPSQPCDCAQFTWAGWTLPFQRVLDKAKEGKR